MSGVSALHGNDASKIKSFRAPQASYTPSNFRWGKMCGLGSYSKVMKATLKETGEEYALKIMNKMHILKENKVNYVKMERMILDFLDHPGVVRLMFTFQDADSLYMGMECCDGGELFDQIRLKGRLTVDETRFYAAELVDILEYIHGVGLVHRDVKPENILLTSDGHLKVIDFGSAKMLLPFPNGVFVDCEDSKARGTFVGTAEYVSPEVLNSQPVTAAADLWALGCVIYQMLEGRAPFKASSEYLCFQKVLSRQFELPPHFPPAAKDLIDRLLDLVPEKRPGAGHLGHDALKSHPFFYGVDWSNVRAAIPPVLAQEVQEANEEDFADEHFDDDGVRVAEWEAAQMGMVPWTLHSESIISAGSSMSRSSNNSHAERPAYQRTVLPTADSDKKETFIASGGCLHRLSTFDVDSSLSSQNPPLQAGPTLGGDCHQPHWQKFLNPYETLIATSLVKTHRGFSTRKRQLMLTDKPRLFYVDPVKMIQKREIEWSANLILRVENAFKFSIYTPNRTHHLEELSGQAWQWKRVIDTLHQRQASDLLLACGCDSARAAY